MYSNKGQEKNMDFVVIYMILKVSKADESYGGKRKPPA